MRTLIVLALLATAHFGAGQRTPGPRRPTCRVPNIRDRPGSPGHLPAEGARGEEGPGPARRGRQRAGPGAVRHGPGRGRLLDRRPRRQSCRASTTTGCSSTASRSTTPPARRSSAPASRPAGSRSPRRASTTTSPRTCRTARSASAGTTRRSTGKLAACFVYTPPGYDADRETRYPGPLPPARRRRGRDAAGRTRAARLHPGQPDRRGEGEADDRGHGARLRRPARGPAARPEAATGPTRRCSARSRT